MLSETPKPRPREERMGKEEVGMDKGLKGGPGLNSINGACGEISEENSEVCSMRQGFSASTTVTKKRIVDEEEVEGEARSARVERSPAAKFQRKRSVSGEIPRNKERDAGIGLGCGSGRSSPSPVKRREGAVGRTYSAREMGQGKAARRGVLVGDGFRRDPGERSGRRSVSPAARRAAELRSATAGGQCRVVPAWRANGQASPLWIPAASTAAVDEDGRRAEEASSGDGSEGKESLENPLVSLECFIFL